MQAFIRALSDPALDGMIDAVSAALDKAVGAGEFGEGPRRDILLLEALLDERERRGRAGYALTEPGLAYAVEVAAWVRAVG